ncbi:MAG TPA: hypothetical protein VL576_02745 [Candidatus Paceibacterota bacterium]|jgi:hypothetical protein|nr:hypothetical protein [Candidatus Paceibacterota bacterium]
MKKASLSFVMITMIVACLTSCLHSASGKRFAVYYVQIHPRPQSQPLTFEYADVVSSDTTYKKGDVVWARDCTKAEADSFGVYMVLSKEMPLDTAKHIYFFTRPIMGTIVGKHTVEL